MDYNITNSNYKQNHRKKPLLYYSTDEKEIARNALFHLSLG